jgi:signal transduction histidine kinase
MRWPCDRSASCSSRPFRPGICKSVIRHVVSPTTLEARKWHRQLADARSELTQLNRLATAGELSAVIAHEVRQPLTAVTAMASAAIANVLRCCLHISSASFGWVVCACVDHAVPSLSSHWRQSRKTSAGSQGSSSAHRRSQRSALRRKRRVRWQRSQTIPCQGADSGRLLLQEARDNRHARVTADFCNKIGHKRTHELQHERKKKDRRAAVSPKSDQVF